MIVETKENELDKEIERRIEIMEKESYNGIPSINKFDVLGMVSTAIICIVGIIYGVL